VELPFDMPPVAAQTRAGREPCQHSPFPAACGFKRLARNV
jgi:hypothetical protein